MSVTLPKETLEKVIKTLNEDKELNPQLRKDVIGMLASYYRVESSGYVVELQSPFKPVCNKITELTEIPVMLVK